MARDRSAVTRPLEHLIVVPGHAIFRDRAGVDPREDEAWWLAEFQRGEGSVFVDQMRRGVELAAADPRALLVPSGGVTHAEAPWSEAEGLVRLAASRDWWGAPSVAAHATAETFARDSFENLLFGLARFREVTGHYPRRVTVVSWPFKAPRFELHAAALRWPAPRFVVEGVGEPADSAQALAGEERARAAFEVDPYGRFGELKAKRGARNPRSESPPHATTCPELAELLDHAGPEPFAGRLPWSDGA